MITTTMTFPDNYPLHRSKAADASGQTLEWDDNYHSSCVDMAGNRAQLNGFPGHMLVTALIVHMFFVCFLCSYHKAVIIEQKMRS